jgi:hypothetical protein
MYVCNKHGLQFVVLLFSEHTLLNFRKNYAWSWDRAMNLVDQVWMNEWMLTAFRAVSHFSTAVFSCTGCRAWDKFMWMTKWKAGGRKFSRPIWKYCPRIWSRHRDLTSPEQWSLHQWRIAQVLCTKFQVSFLRDKAMHFDGSDIWWRIGFMQW